MPDVGSNQFRAAKGANDFVQGIPYGKLGTTGGPNNDGWKYGYAVYVHNGTEWIEVWNARPQMVSTSMATTSSTGLTFTGTADPNNFATTAKFEYREVGTSSYSDSGTTTTGLGDGVDGAVSYTVAATVSSGDTWKNWEARASGTNAGGTGTGSTITLDCRQHDAGQPAWNTSDSSNASTCDGCGTVTTRTYSKTGCQSYTRTIATCGTWNQVTTAGTYTTTDGVTRTYVSFTDWLGFGGYLGTASCNQGQCGCVPQDRLAYEIQQCSVTGVYRLVSTYCVRVSFM